MAKNINKEDQALGINLKFAHQYSNTACDVMKKGMVDALNECAKFIDEAASKGQFALRFNETTPEGLMKFLEIAYGFKVSKLENGEFLVSWE